MLAALKRIRRALIALLHAGLMLAVALLVCDVLWGVVTRYVVGEQSRWTEELARFLLIWVSLLGGAAAFGTKGHLGVDALTSRFHPDTQRAVAIVGHLGVLAFAVAIVLTGGGRLVAESLRLEQVTPALGWKMGHVYLALPISGVFMVIFTLEQILEILLTRPGLPSSDGGSGEERP